jgi:hypothetical protein
LTPFGETFGEIAARDLLSNWRRINGKKKVSSKMTCLGQGTAQRISRAGSFELPCSADVAFPLFSPEGERDWVKDWAPSPVFPERIQFARDTVFREGSAGEEAVWTILDVDRQLHRAEYVRLAPQSHTARIVVKIKALGPQRSRVAVTYTITAFGVHAASLMEAFAEEAYAAKMSDWQRQISAYLGSRSR